MDFYPSGIFLQTKSMSYSIILMMEGEDDVKKIKVEEEKLVTLQL